MQRKLMCQLESWKASDERRPLLVMGARQVGKTWLMKEFGRTSFSRTAYLRFDNDAALCALFEADYNLTRILAGIEILVGFKISPENTLIVFDEIQECPRALTALKYFCEERRDLFIVAAGSFLGLAEHEGTGFPVGKVDRLTLRPMSFHEFLLAVGESRLAEAVDKKDFALCRPFSARLVDLLKTYLFVGGMPEVVAGYVAHGDFRRVRARQNALLEDFRDDFSKHAPKETVPRINLVWDSLPVQLAKENKKFVYSHVKAGLRSKDLEDALQWLVSVGLISKVARVTCPMRPLISYEDGAFKLFSLDVGLLCAQAKVNARLLLEGDRLFREFKGALAEQYVQQELRAVEGEVFEPHYWANENSTAEVDFIVETECGVWPIEVKAEKNLRAKSVKTFCERFHLAEAVRTSLADEKDSVCPIEGEVLRIMDVPLWAIAKIGEICQMA